MLNFRKFYFLLLGFVLLGSVAFGQAARSPFSFRGIGEPYGNSLVHNQGMAGVGISNPQYYYLNNHNPALLVFNRFTVFSAGFLAERRTIKGEGASEQDGNGNLNYLAIAFPVKFARWSTSIGLMPYSTVNYRLNYTDAIEGTTNTVNVEETGTGGINQVYWSNGVALHKNISIGLKAAYLFSSIENTYSNNIDEATTVPYYPSIYERTYVKDLRFTGGFSFHKDSLTRKNHKLNIGLVYDFKTELNSKYYSRLERRNFAGIIDSTVLVNDAPGSITLPSSIAAGVSFAKGEYWVVGTDFTYYDFQQFRDYNGSSQEGTKAWKWALGLELTPDPSALGSYLKRMTYRTGISYEKYPYLINGNPVMDLGINLGFSTPVSRYSSLDFAVKVGKRGNLQDNTIEENYFKIYFGVTFNDQWFIRRRFD